MRKSRLFITLLLFFVTLTIFSIDVSASNSVKKIVVYNDGVTLLEKNEVGQKYGLSVVKELDLIKGQSVFVSRNKVEELQNDPRVQFVVDDHEVTIIGRPERPPRPEPDPEPEPTIEQFIPWGVDAVEADLVWGSYTGVGVKVGVIDTGIDLDHPDLAGNIKGGINTINTRKSYDDDNGHGTHVAGTIGAIDNTEGVIGVAPNVDLYGIKVLDRRGSGSTSDVIMGLEWAVAQGLDVVNMSLGSAYYNEAFALAVTEAYNAGVIIVAASGNENTSVNYPAAYPEVIAVGAIDKTLTRASFSNYGLNVDVVAPGVAIESTYTEGRYAYMDGTSMASPHVAGVIALMLESGSVTTLEDVRARFAQTSIDLGAPGFDIYYGHGLVDVSASTP